MSEHLYTPAYGTRLGNLTAKSVLVRLCSNADDNGETWVGNGRIAQDTEISTRTLERTIEIFEAMGLIERKWMLHTDRYGTRKKRFIYINLAKLGTDLTVEFAEAFAAAQGKKKGTGAQAVDEDDTLFGEGVSETGEGVCETGGEGVSETVKGVSQTEKGVSQTVPPHPLIGGTVIELSLNKAQLAPTEENGIGLTIEQQEHLDRIAAGKPGSVTLESWRLHYVDENRKALELAAARDAEAAKDRELQAEYPDLKTGLKKMRTRCGFSWAQGDKLGPVLEQVCADQLELGKPIWRVIAQMEAMWHLHIKQAAVGRLWRRCGPMEFYRDGYWIDQGRWHWDAEVLKREIGAGVGSER